MLSQKTERENEQVGGYKGLMSRNQRQLKILEIISKNDIDKQEVLVDKLIEEGFSVTQATVSRDIRDMGIIKTLTADGKGYRYVSQKANEEERSSDKFHKLFKSSVLSIASSENIIVVKTESGAASSAAALIDRLFFEEVLGVVAGDDTIFIVVASKEKTPMAIQKLEALMN